MENQKEKILNFISDKEYIPMKAKQIAEIMCVPKNEYTDFLQLLNELTSEYKIRANKKGKYLLVDSNKYKKGKLRINSRGFGFVAIDNSDEEIYISTRNLNNALNEDTVIAEIIKDEQNGAHKEGKIIEILTHEKNTIVGIFENNKSFGFVIPDDKNFGSDIFISKKNCGKAKNREKVVVEITKYPERGKNAEGKIVEILGNIDMAGVDMLSLIKEHNLPYEFPEGVLEEAKNIKKEISPNELVGRLDLRSETLFTIDGDDAKDLDDAVCVKKNESGNYELIVAIADVSHYVKEGSELDKEAIIRGTSIYMMDRVIPMLPTELSNGICSLNAHEDRLAICVTMEINNQAKVLSSDIKKCVINVKERMSYKNVYEILQFINNQKVNSIYDKSSNKQNTIQSTNLVNEECTDYEINKIINRYKQYIPNFSLMQELAKILKNKRIKDGALDLDVPESKIVLDENGRAIDVKKYEINFANEIIEQFMLIANEVVAEKFFWLEAPFIYRVHEVPDEDKVKELNKFLFNMGYKIKYNKDNIHPKSFAEVLEKIKDTPEERVISNLILRTLKVARYESTNKGHFGIASKYYCHFTSPIRRYPDLYIHRIISKYINNNYNVDQDFINKYSEQAVKYADRSSEREKIAQKVERDSEDIKKAEFMENKIGEEYDGIISSITSFGIFVELENTVEGLIRFENLGNEYFIYNEDKKILVGESTNTIYKIGQSVRIQVIEASKELRRVSFALVK